MLSKGGRKGSLGGGSELGSPSGQVTVGRQSFRRPLQTWRPEAGAGEGQEEAPGLRARIAEECIVGLSGL